MQFPLYIKQCGFVLDERSLGSAMTFVFGLCVLQIRLVVFSLIYALWKFVFGFGLLVWVTDKYLFEGIDQQCKFLFVLGATLNLWICEGGLFWFGYFFFFLVQSLALILVLGAPSKQKICKVFLSGLMLTYMRDILVN